MLKASVCVLLISILYSNSLSAQDSAKHSLISYSGYIDAYAAHYTDSVGQGNYQKFPSVSPRSNQMGLNVAMFTAKYSAQKIRATATLHFGDIPASAWSSKYNIIQEANTGLLLCKNLWLDAVLSSMQSSG